MQFLLFSSTTPGLTHPPVTSSLYVCYFCWHCMSLSCLPYKWHRQPWKHQHVQRLPQLQPWYWDTSVSHTVSSIVLPGNDFGHILGCWIRGDWAERRSERQWHDLTLTVKENSIQVTRTVDGKVPTRWDYIKKSSCDGAVLEGQFTTFQLICVFSPWWYVFIHSTCKVFQRNLKFSWPQNGNPKQLDIFDICLTGLQLCLSKTMNYIHLQKGMKMNSILVIVPRTTEEAVRKLTFVTLV